MTKLRVSTVAILSVLIAAPAFGKAHDQGKAHFPDGNPTFGPGDAAGVVDDVVRDGLLIGAEDPNVPGKALGEDARDAKGDNRTVPAFKD